MGLFKNYVSQTRKPEGFLGKMMLKGMNSGHAKMADWGLTHLKKIYPQTIVDLVSFGTCHRVLVFTVTGTQLHSDRYPVGGLTWIPFGPGKISGGTSLCL